MNGYYNTNKRNIFLPKCNYADDNGSGSDIELDDTDEKSSTISPNDSNESLNKNFKLIIDSHVDKCEDIDKKISDNSDSRFSIKSSENGSVDTSSRKYLDEQALKRKMHKAEIK